MTTTAMVRVRMESGMEERGAIERVIAAVTGSGVRMQNVRRCGKNAVECTLRAEDLLRIRPALRVGRCRLRILRRFGAPFFLRRSARRGALILGVILAVTLALTAISMVWMVRVEGDADADERILQILEESGARPWVFQRTLDLKELESILARRVTDLSWVDVKMRGVVLVVDARGSNPPPEIYDRQSPDDVLASEDGMIEEIIVYEGTAAVRRGQIVKAGDMLIRGEITLRDGSVQSVRAQGRVTARQWYKGEGEAAPHLYARYDTGRTQTRRTVELLQWTVKTPEEVEFKEYRAEESRFALLGGVFIPARVTVETVYEQKIIEDIRSLDEMISEALRSAEENALAKLPEGGVPIDKRTEYAIMNSGTLHANVYLEILREIALP